MFKKIGLLASLLLRDDIAGNRSLSRYRSILRGGVTAILAKAVSVGTGLATVPLTVHYLGPERYGLWASLFSVLSWLTMADLGLSNGLLNALSNAVGAQRPDLARQYVSTAFWGLATMSLVVLTLALLGRGHFDWARLVRTENAATAREFGQAASMILFCFLVNLPCTMVARVLTALQRPEVANLWAIATSIASLIGLLTCVSYHGSLSALVVGFYGSQVLVSVASIVWLFRRYPELRPSRVIYWSSARKVFGVSAACFVSQIANMMIFQSGTLIIAHGLGAQFVAPYQIAWLLTLYVMVPQQLVGSSVWAAIGEAWGAGDHAWIRGLVRRYSIAGFITGGPWIAVLLFAGDRVVQLWSLGTVRPPRQLVCWMAAWAAELVLMQPIQALLGGIGKLRGYAIFNMTAAVFAVIGGIVTVKQFGAAGVIASTVISFLCIALIPGAYLATRVLRRTPHSSETAYSIS